MSIHKPLETRQIRYFVAVAEELHFGRAALRLGIAQPALSGQIKALERELETELLVRSTRSVELTRAGEELLARCQRILREISDAAATARGMGREGRRTVAIGSIHPATLGVLPRFLKALSRRFSDTSIEVLNAETETLVKRVEHGAINIAFVRPVEQAHGLRYREIGKDRYLLALPSRSPLAKQPTLSLKDLRGQKIIARSKQGVGLSERYFKELFSQSGLEHDVAFQCNDTVSILSLVSNGLGMGFVPGWTQGFADESVALRRVVDVDYEVGLGIIWRREETAFYSEEIVELAREAFTSSTSNDGSGTH